MPAKAGVCFQEMAKCGLRLTALLWQHFLFASLSRKQVHLLSLFTVLLLLRKTKESLVVCAWKEFKKENGIQYLFSKRKIALQRALILEMCPAHILKLDG